MSNSPTGREWKTSKMIAEPRLYKKTTEKKKKKNLFDIAF